MNITVKHTIHVITAIITILANKIFKIEKRGFIKEGYFADLVIVNSGLPWSVKKENIFAKCGWSPFEGFTFKNRIDILSIIMFPIQYKIETKTFELVLFDSLEKYKDETIAQFIVSSNDIKTQSHEETSKYLDEIREFFDKRLPELNIINN